MLSPDDIPVSGKGSYTSQFDDTPIKPSSFNSQLKGSFSIPEDFSEEPDQDTGPLPKRLDSKNWKTRCRAYEELTGLLYSSNALFAEFASSVHKFISDSNPGAQEKGLDIIKVYLLRSPDLLIPSSESLTKSLIEKCLTSAKVPIKNEAATIILDFFAVHKDNFEGFFAGLLYCINNKNVKVQAAGINTATTVLSLFGVKKLPFKVFIGSIEKAAGASNPAVRSEALNFYKETFKWVRELINPFVDKLKKAQQDELKLSFEEIKDVPCPSRWIKSEEALARTQKTELKNNKLDVYDMADAKDIFLKYNEKWANTVLAMEKWTDKKQALEELNTEANYPKLAEKNPIDLVTLAKRLINDSNLQVMLQAIKLVGLLAKGQRKFFDSFGRQFFPVILQKFKDKKTQVLSEVNICLDNLLFSFSLESVLEDLKLALDDPNPLVKANSCLWVDRIVENGQELKNSVKILAGLCKKNTDDSSPEVRSAAFKLLGTLLKKFPEVVQGVVRDLPTAKLKKLEEPEKVKNEEKKVEKIEEKKEPKTPQPKKPPLKDPAAKTPQKVEDEEVTSSLTAEEAEAVVSGVLPVEMLKQLKDNAWKEKQAGLISLSSWCQSNSEFLCKNSEAVLRFVRVTVKEWKENNFNVVKAALELYKQANESCTVSKRSAFGVLNPAALDKLSDSKLVEIYSACIFSYSETLGPKFVVSCLIKGTSECSKPKVVSESFTCISKIVSEFGIHSISLKDLLDYVKSALNQANPAIKKSAHSLAVLLYSFLGEKILPLLTDIKDSTLKALQEDFSKTPLLTKTSFKSFKGQEEIKADPKRILDDVLPRNNIEKLITPGLLKKFSDSNWKVRKEALDEFEAILDSNACRVLPIGLEVINKNLIGRLTDPNKAVVRQVLLLSGKLAGSLGTDSKVFAKQFVPAIINCLADKQNLLRQDAMVAINKWAEEAGPDVVIGLAYGPLMIENPEIRSELLKWLTEHKESFKLLDMKVYAGSVLACLQDRSASIRNLAEIFFAEVVEIVGFECFQAYLKDIKPAVLNTLLPVFEKFGCKTEESAPKTRMSGSVTQERSGSRDLSRKKTSVGPRAVEEIKSPIKKSRSVMFSSLEISFVSIGNKEKRLESEAKNKWSVEDFRPDFQERTKEQVRACFSLDLFNFLYNPDFKKQVEGVVHLQTLMISNKKDTVEVVDIVFKWTWLTLQENANTQLHKAIFEMLQLLVNTLAELNYTLQEIEANLFFPIICEKSGNSTFKSSIRGLIHSATAIYPVDKVFVFVLSGCNSKSTKSKVECLEELASLIQDFGISITQVKDIKQIVKYASSLDNNVRTAAVQTMGEIYKLAGDKTWTMVGEVTDKVKDLLEQRFRAVTGSSASSNRRISLKEPMNKTITPKHSKSKNPEERLPQSPKGEEGGSTERGPERNRVERKSLLNLTFKRKADESKTAKEPKSPLLEAKRAESSQVDSKPASFQERSRAIISKKEELEKSNDTSKSIDRSVDTSKSSDVFNKRSILSNSLEKSTELKAETKVPSFGFTKKVLDIPVEKANTLVEDEEEGPVITEESMLCDSFKIDEIGVSELDKNLETLKNGDISSRVDALVAINDLILNNLDSNREEVQIKANNISEAMTKVIISTFERPLEDIPLRFAKYFLNVLHKVCSTRMIIRELTESNLYILVEQVLTRLLIEELEKIGEKGEGEMMLKTLNGTMLRLLDHAAPSKIILVLIRLLSKYRAPIKLAKMPSMITRCLMKLMKGMQTIIQQLEIGKVLVAMHEYLIQIKTSPNEDLGVKTLKTFVIEIVKVQGNGIWQGYDLVRQHHAPDLLIEKWILSALNLSVNPFVDPPKPKLDPAVLDSIELIKMDFNAGIMKLSEQLEKNPSIDIEVYLNNCSKKLSGQILESLREIRESKLDRDDNMMSGYNFQDFQKRLSVMKQRYGISNVTAPVEINSTLSDLKTKVNNLLNKPPVPDDQNFVNDLRTRIQNLNRVNK